MTVCLQAAWSSGIRDVAREGSRTREWNVMNSDGSNPLNLTNDAAHDDRPSWSMDGSRLAFASGRTGDFEVFAMDADGSGPINLSNAPGAFDFPGSPQAWSP